MKRRDFVSAAGSAAAALAAGGLAAAQDRSGQTPAPPPPPKRRRYKIDIEIFEARPDSWCHKKGDTFAYPADWGKLCPWLRASLNEFVRLLENGVTLPWMYEGTAYAKVIDPDGVTTEYVRCPDPTSNLVSKIIRTRV
jgi:uncharacterized repeat protein (TIGR04076 family)